jgi:ATP-dependent RNA helicase DOB1
MIDRNDNNLEEFIKISEKDTEPIRSQFQLSYNTVLNLIANYEPEEVERILKSNFDYYIKKKMSSRQVRVMASFNNKKRQLQKLSYTAQNDELTPKGSFARFIYFEELLISELFTTHLYKKLSDTEILQLIAGIIYEQKSNDYFSFKNIQSSYNKLQKTLQQNAYVTRNLNLLSLKRMMALVGSWSNNSSFDDLLSLTNLLEGDIIRLFRRIIDMIGQINRATTDYELKERLSSCTARIDRGLVAVNY